MFNYCTLFHNNTQLWLSAVLDSAQIWLSAVPDSAQSASVLARTTLSVTHRCPWQRLAWPSLSILSVDCFGILQKNFVRVKKRQLGLNHPNRLGSKILWHLTYCTFKRNFAYYTWCFCGKPVFDCKVLKKFKLRIFKLKSRRNAITRLEVEAQYFINDRVVTLFLNRFIPHWIFYFVGIILGP